MDGLLVFDGECGFCTRSRDLLVRLDRRRRLETAAFQEPGVTERTGIGRAEFAESVWWFGADGSRLRGAAAVNAALGAALGFGLPLAVYRVPGIRQAQEAAYRWVAANRYRFPGTTPWCTRHPGRC